MNEPLRRLLSSGVSLRRAALLLCVHRITVDRKLRFLAAQARQSLSSFRASLSPLAGFQFDDLETFEQTKYKPLSVTLAVTQERKILGFEVSSMPAKGLLAEKARQKYGRRRDGRGEGLAQLFQTIRPLVTEQAILRSDQNPHYPACVRRFFPQAIHIRERGGRGCVVGQGELKALRHDPLFSLNHTFAMLRANLSRLIRRTWCTTKKAERLADHLAIYAHFHNDVLLSPIR